MGFCLVKPEIHSDNFRSVQLPARAARVREGGLLLPANHLLPVLHYCHRLLDVLLDRPQSGELTCITLGLVNAFSGFSAISCSEDNVLLPALANPRM